MRPARTAGRKDGAIASYHFSVQIIGRTEGRSAIAAAAYRAGVRLCDKHNGQVVDYRCRRGVAHSEILLPQGSASWLADRERLWNAVETMEKRADAQLAREINLALPHELSDAQRIGLLRGFVTEQFVSRGMVADIAIHHPVAEKGDDPRNIHAHILLTLRQATCEGLRAVKTREWNSDTCLLAWRQAWAAHQNRWLRLYAPRAEPVDARTLAAQKASAQQRGDLVAAIRLDRLPELHVGVASRHLSRRGWPSADPWVSEKKRRRSNGGPAVALRRGRAGLSLVERREARHRTRDTGAGPAKRVEANRQRLAGNQARYDTALRRWRARSALLANMLHQRRRAGQGLDRGRDGSPNRAQSRRRIALLLRLIALVEAVLVALLSDRGRLTRRLNALRRPIGVDVRRSTQRRYRRRRRGPAGST